jgi:hypothetical protein
VRDFFYGMTVHERGVETRRARAGREHLFMLIAFCDLIGHPIPAPLYSMRLLPFILPGVRRWKLLVLRERDLTERDLTDLGRVEI